MKTKNSKTAKAGTKPTALGVQELALLGWLAEDPAARFAIASDRSFACYERLSPLGDGKHPVRKLADWEIDDHSTELKKWFGGKISCKYQRLCEAGHAVSHVMLGLPGKNDRVRFQEAVADVHISGSWNLSSVYVGITASGAEWWRQEGHRLHSAHLEKIAEAAAKAAAAERRALFGWMASFDRKIPEAIQDMIPSGTDLPLPKLKGVRPMFTAIIVRETAERYYVRDVRPIDRGNSVVAYVGLRDHGKERYIDKDRLLLDHVTDAALASISSFDREQQQDHNERCRRAAEEMLPILKRLSDSARQTEAEHEDRLRELLAKLRND
jgi:hypothetical protein